MENKRAGGAALSAVSITILAILRIVRCEAQSHRYDYTYTPSYNFTPSYDLPKYDSVDTTKKAIDDLLTADANWQTAFGEIDPFAVAGNAKNVACTALAGADEESASWTITTSDTLLSDDAPELTIKSPYPLTIVRGADEDMHVSPEAAARSEQMFANVSDGGTVYAPTLVKKDLYLQVTTMPKPSKTVKRLKGIAPGQVIVKGWLFDHYEGRMVCAGVFAVPKPAKGTGATQLSEAQITTLIAKVPDSLRAIPAPAE